MIKWEIPPSVLIEGLDKYEQQVLLAIHAVAAYWGQSIQDLARRNAKWEDRTGNARSGLFFAVDGFGYGEIVGAVSSAAAAEMTDTAVEQGDNQTLIITLGHTVFYGKWLELSNAGKYAVVMSTIEANLPQLERMLRDVLTG